MNKDFGKASGRPGGRLPWRTIRRVVTYVAMYLGSYAALLWILTFAGVWFWGLGLLVTIGYAAVAILLCDMMLPGVNLVAEAPARLPDELARDGYVALTFDDGPVSPFTEEILAILDRYGAKATFFALGENIEKNRDLAREISKRGHTLANHSYSHRLLPFLNRSEIRKEIESTADLIASVTGSRPVLLRCPKGYKSWKVARVSGECGHRLVGFSYPIFDVENPPAEILVERVSKRLRAGDILLMHDGYSPRKVGSRSSLVQALPQILELIKSRGLKPISLDQAYRSRQLPS